MDNEIELKGFWFLPNNRDISFTGSFHYNRIDGCYLVIMGSFDKAFLSQEHPIIHGNTLGGGDITLFECFRISSELNLENITVSKYFATYVLIGYNFKEVKDLQFTSIKASISDLEDWVNIYGFEKLHFSPKEKSIELIYKKPKNLAFNITDDIDVNFEFEYNFPIYKQVAKVQISQTTYISLSLKNALSVEELFNPFFILYRFLTFAYYDSPHILSIKLIHATIYNIIGESKIKYPLQVDLLYSDNFFNKNYKKGSVLQKSLFTYNQLHEHFPSMIKNWFSLYVKIGSAINLFNELLLKREHSIEIKFLSAIQAIETFHRNLYGGYDLSQSEHSDRLNSIYTHVPEKLQTWLKSKLAFSNEISLRKRLMDLYSRIPTEVTSKLILDQKLFINEVLDARNYYTHYDPSLKNNIMSVEDISKAVEKLKILLVCLLLNELGLDDNNIIKIVQVQKFYPY